MLLAVAILGLGLGGVALASINGSGATSATVTVTVANGKLSFSTRTLPAGTVTFVAVNKDTTTTHGFAVMGLGLNKRTAAIPVGESLKLTVTLKPGTYHFWDPVRSSMAKATYITVKGTSVSKSVSVTVASGKLTFLTKPLPAGTVTFVVVNKGTTTHAFAVMGLGLNKRTAAIQPGKSATLTVKLTGGTYHFWDPVRSTMAKAVYVTVKGAATSSPSSSSSSSTGSTGGTGGGGTYPVIPGDGMDHGGDGCDH
jgi:uncharacterized cupredoxin-like copper-binding protein